MSLFQEASSLICTFCARKKIIQNVELVRHRLYCGEQLRLANELWFSVSQCCNGEELSIYLKAPNLKSSQTASSMIREFHI